MAEGQSTDTLLFPDPIVIRLEALEGLNGLTGKRQTLSSLSTSPAGDTVARDRGCSSLVIS